jgi:predicted DNA-binding transcriptional regulator YafY
VRLEKAAMLLDLARRLASSAEGLTLDEMADHLQVHRRTAMRMRDALVQLFPHLEEIADGRTKRFRITSGLDGLYQSPTPEELATLNHCAVALRAEGASVRANALENLAAKVRAATRRQALTRLIPDLEALVRAECIAIQAGPRVAEDEVLLATIRLALLSMRKVAFKYDGGAKPGEERTAVPYGLMFGRQNYLVGSDSPQDPVTKHWRLDRISDMRALDQPGGAPDDFDLRIHAEGSFGIFRDDMEDVVLRIMPEAGQAAARWRFHPAQTVDPLEDGGYRVRFRSSGMLELAWHLFTWRDLIEVEAPERLKTTMRDELKVLVGHLGLASDAPAGSSAGEASI